MADPLQHKASPSLSNDGLPRCIFIFDSTRLRSHLFFRFLSTHPDVAPIYHPFLPAAQFGPEYYVQHLRHSEMRRKEVEEEQKPLRGTETYEDCRLAFEKAVSEAERHGKVALVNEHWFNLFPIHSLLALIRTDIDDLAELGQNPTYIPESIFNTLCPIVLIRHPALSVDSINRTAQEMTKMRPTDEDFSLITANRHLRLIFDYFGAQGRQPIVVDAEDILWRTGSVAKALCTKLGLDPDGLSDTWTPTPREQVDRMNPVIYMLTKTLHDSSGIERPSEKPDEPDLDKMVVRWSQGYGDEVADQLRQLAAQNVPHYEYLRQFTV